MEVTFFNLFPLNAVLLLGLHKLVTATAGSIEAYERGKLFLYIYVAMSLVTFGHYVVDPPHVYALDVNASIMIEGFAAIALIFVVRHMKSAFLAPAQVTSDVEVEGLLPTTRNSTTATANRATTSNNAANSGTENVRRRSRPL
jgi:hypothetical protein